MLARLATGLVAILTFRRRTNCLTGPAKVIDGDTIVVAGGGFQGEAQRG